MMSPELPVPGIARAGLCHRERRRAGAQRCAPTKGNGRQVGNLSPKNGGGFGMTDRGWREGAPGPRRGAGGKLLPNRTALGGGGCAGYTGWKPMLPGTVNGRRAWECPPYRTADGERPRGFGSRTTEATGMGPQGTPRSARLLTRLGRSRRLVLESLSPTHHDIPIPDRVKLPVALGEALSLPDGVVEFVLVPGDNHLRIN